MTQITWFWLFERWELTECGVTLAVCWVRACHLQSVSFNTDCAAHWVNTQQHLPIEQSRSASLHKRNCVKNNNIRSLYFQDERTSRTLTWTTWFNTVKKKATFTQKQTHRDERQHTLFSLKRSWLCRAVKALNTSVYNCPVQTQVESLSYPQNEARYFCIFADFYFCETAPQQPRPSKVRRHNHTNY